MIETLDAVFVKGSLFKRLLDPASVTTCRVSGSAAVEEPLPRVHTAVSDAGKEVGFISAIVLRNLRRKFVLCRRYTSALVGGPDVS